MKEQLYQSIVPCIVPSISAVCAEVTCGLQGVLEFFFLCMFVRFAGHFMRVNYGKRHWLARVLLKNRWFVSCNILMAVILYNFSLAGVAVTAIGWEVGMYSAWRTNAFDKLFS